MILRTFQLLISIDHLLELLVGHVLAELILHALEVAEGDSCRFSSFV